jgi:predicted dinucleotide-binding enzyme
MTIGIIGAGGIGQAFAAHMAKAGYEVIVSNSRGPESLAEVVRQLGPRVRAGTRQEAAQADVVVVAVPWPQVRAALSDLPAWNGRTLIDTTNPVVQPGFRLAGLNGSTSSEIVASLAPGARVVKVANTLLRAPCWRPTRTRREDIVCCSCQEMTRPPKRTSAASSRRSDSPRLISAGWRAAEGCNSSRAGRSQL